MTDPPAAGARMRLLTAAAGPRAGTAELAAAVRAARADVVCLRGVATGWRGPGRWAALARACGLYVAAATPRGGTLVLVALRVAVRRAETVELSGARLPVQAAVAELDCDRAGWTVASVDLAAAPALGRRQADELAYRLADASGTLVVAGEVGPDPAGARGRLGERLTDISAGVAGRPAGLAVLLAGPGRSSGCAVPLVVAAGLPAPVLAVLAAPGRPGAAGSERQPAGAVDRP